MSESGMPSNGGSCLPADGPGEFHCPECGRRCTRGPDGTEYGHERGVDARLERCSRRDPKLDTTGVGGRSSTGGSS